MRLRLYATHGGSGFAVGSTDSSWTEKGITFANAPQPGTAVNTPAPHGAGWQTVDVSALVTGSGTYSLGVTAPGSTPEVFASREAGGATALFIAGFGAAGYATRRDLAVIGRISFVALIALIVFGIVLIFIHIPHGELVYSVLGLLRMLCGDM